MAVTESRSTEVDPLNKQGKIYKAKTCDGIESIRLINLIHLPSFNVNNLAQPLLEKYLLKHGLHNLVKWMHHIKQI